MKKITLPALAAFGLMFCASAQAQVVNNSGPGPGPVPCAYTNCTITSLNVTAGGSLAGTFTGTPTLSGAYISTGTPIDNSSGGSGFTRIEQRSGVNNGAFYQSANNTQFVGQNGQGVVLSTTAGTAAPTISYLMVNGSAPSGGAIGDITPGATDNSVNFGVPTIRWKGIYGASIFGNSFFGAGSIPTVTGTGTPTISARSTDTAGEVTSGTAATSVVITFSSTKTNAPFCTVTAQTQLVAFAYTISTTAITVTQTATTGEKIDYHCFQN